MKPTLEEIWRELGEYPDEVLELEVAAGRTG
jgi:hypothetical protein